MEVINKNAVLELSCQCQVLDQLRKTFVELGSSTIHSAADFEFSCITKDGPVVLSSGYEIYNNIRPELSFYHSQLPQLFLHVRILDVSVIAKLDDLGRTVNECKATMKSDKAWRVMKDTEIAEGQLSLQELLDKQQLEIKSLQKDISEMKLENQCRKKEDKNSFKNKEVHEASCDKCQDLIIGHRFKCAICYNYDLCETCEAAGVHAQHALIRLVSENTLFPEHLIVKNPEEVKDQNGQVQAIASSRDRAIQVPLRRLGITPQAIATKNNVSRYLNAQSDRNIIEDPWYAQHMSSRKPQTYERMHPKLKDTTDGKKVQKVSFRDRFYKKAESSLDKHEKQLRFDLSASRQEFIREKEKFRVEKETLMKQKEQIEEMMKQETINFETNRAFFSDRFEPIFNKVKDGKKSEDDTTRKVEFEVETAESNYPGSIFSDEDSLSDLAEILKDIEEYECSSESSDDQEKDDFDVVEEEAKQS